jgi:hypothetical protein
MNGARDGLLSDAAIARFVAWVTKKHPDFHAPTRKARSG